MGSVTELGRSPEVENGNSFQYSCLKIPMNRGAYWATVQRIAESQAQLTTDTHTHTHAHNDLKAVLGTEYVLNKF